MITTVARQLDRVRSPLVGAVLGRSTALRAALAHRDSRLALGATIALFTALAVSFAAPGAWFLWGLLLLGIPHVLADARYLLLSPYRRITLRRLDALLVIGLLAFSALGTPWIGAAIIVAAVALSPRAARPPEASATGPLSDERPDARAANPRGAYRRGAVLAAALGFAAVAWAWPINTAYLIMHAHNVVALVVLAVLADRKHIGWSLLAGALAMCAAVLSGALDAVLPMAALDSFAGYVLPDAALDGWSAVACARVALTFVFLQGLHYAVWLRLLPAALRPHGGMRGFGASLRALERDCTAPVVALVVLAAIALPLLALVGARDAGALRMLYVQLAGCHAYLELAVLARWLAA